MTSQSPEASDNGSVHDDAHAPPPARAARGRDIVLAVLGLSAVAVAQPLLDLIGRNPPFFVAHNMTSRDVIAFAVLVAIIAPLVVGLVLAGVARVHRRAGVTLAAAVLGALAALLVLVVTRLSGVGEDVPVPLAIVVAAVVGVGLAAAWVRSATVRRMLDVLSLAAPAALVLFLLASPAKTVVNPPDPPPAATQVSDDAAPIVMLIFDELPIVTLMNAEREIDRETFPAFGRLADDGTWYRNATTVAGFTPNAVPAILTGRYTDPEALPLASDHPQNLFSILRGTYSFHVVEPVTDLCTDVTCESPDPANYGQILRDLAVVEGHLVAPGDLAERLPSLDEGFANFEAEVAAKGKHDAFVDMFHEVLGENLPEDFARFVDGIQAERRRALNFAHVLLPHRPWRYLPDGRPYAGMEGTPGVVNKRWREYEWASRHGYQRHVLQVQLVDRLMGDLLAKLDHEGIYDDALIVIASDHGVTFEPGAPLRSLSEHAESTIAPVPVLIKAPRQAQGVVTDAPIETIDILPTMLELLGVPAPKGLDGQSAVDPDEVKRDSKTFLSVRGTQTYSADGEAKYRALRRKLDVFGEQTPIDPFTVAPQGTRRLLGAAVPQAPPAEGMRAALDAPEVWSAVDTTAAAVPALLTGTVTTAADRRPTLAIGVNGRIVAVTEADVAGEPGTHAFRAMIPPAALRTGANDITILEVGRGRRLRSVPLG